MEAHKPDQTDQLSPGTDHLRTHQAVTQRKTVARGGKVGSAEPQVQPNPPEPRPGAFWREISTDPLEVGYECFHV